jgi:hypothetical protein
MVESNGIHGRPCGQLVQVKHSIIGTMTTTVNVQMFRAADFPHLLIDERFRRILASRSRKLKLWLKAQLTTTFEMKPSIDRVATSA